MHITNEALDQTVVVGTDSRAARLPENCVNVGCSRHHGTAIVVKVRPSKSYARLCSPVMHDMHLAVGGGTRAQRDGQHSDQHQNAKQGGQPEHVYVSFQEWHLLSLGEKAYKQLALRYNAHLLREPHKPFWIIPQKAFTHQVCKLYLVSLHLGFHSLYSITSYEIALVAHSTEYFL